MRNLTITRKKSFVACFAKLKVYIEDPTSEEITINSVPCRKLGDLKNGEEKTFQIDDQAAKVYVIADKLSKNYCNEYYQLPEGQEDISLAGENKFNPANGNAFRFYDNDSSGVAQNRKRGTRIGLIVLIIAVIVGGAIGYFGTKGLFTSWANKPTTYTVDGMSITLPNEFVQTEVEPYTAAFDSEKIAVFALKEEFTVAEGAEDYTVEEYGDLVMQANGLSDTELNKADGLISFVYDNQPSVVDDTYRYFTYLFKSDDAFWIVQFATYTEGAEEYSQQIQDLAKTVEFN